MRHVYVSLDKKVNVANHVKYSLKLQAIRFVLAGLFVQLYIQLFRERLSEKVHVPILKGIVGGFAFTVLQRN